MAIGEGVFLNEGDPYGDCGGLRSLWGTMTHEVLHHRVFGHVLHKVCLGGVRPAAHAAAVGFSVLDGVRREVYLQRGGVRVRAEAIRTLIRLVLVVLPLVRLKVGELCEGFFTSRVSTFIWPVTSVNSGVLLQVRQLAEGFLAVGAVVGFDPQVYAQVLS